MPRLQILPPTTEPNRSPLERLHTPSKTTTLLGYRYFRPCLRWEFGFTCAFCLIHEADLHEFGVEGTGLTWIEHFVPVGLKPELGNEYTNCFYSCRFCNSARGTRANEDEVGRRLLNPCEDVWGEHFEICEDRLVPLTRHGEYTLDIYDLNDARKVRCRQRRRERLGEWLELIKRGPRMVIRLLDHAIEVQDPTLRRELLDEAELLRRFIKTAERELIRFRALPDDRDRSCRCDHTDHHRLPKWLLRQVFEFSVQASATSE